MGDTIQEPIEIDSNCITNDNNYTEQVNDENSSNSVVIGQQSDKTTSLTPSTIKSPNKTILKPQTQTQSQSQTQTQSQSQQQSQSQPQQQSQSQTQSQSLPPPVYQQSNPNQPSIRNPAIIIKAKEPINNINIVSEPPNKPSPPTVSKSLPIKPQPQQQQQQQQSQQQQQPINVSNQAKSSTIQQPTQTQQSNINNNTAKPRAAPPLKLVITNSNPNLKQKPQSQQTIPQQSVPQQSIPQQTIQQSVPQQQPNQSQQVNVNRTINPQLQQQQQNINRTAPLPQQSNYKPQPGVNYQQQQPQQPQYRVGTPLTINRSPMVGMVSKQPMSSSQQQSQSQQNIQRVPCQGKCCAGLAVKPLVPINSITAKPPPYSTMGPRGPISGGYVRTSPTGAIIGPSPQQTMSRAMVNSMPIQPQIQIKPKPSPINNGGIPITTTTTNPLNKSSPSTLTQSSNTLASSNNNITTSNSLSSSTSSLPTTSTTPTTKPKSKPRSKSNSNSQTSSSSTTTTSSTSTPSTPTTNSTKNKENTTPNKGDDSGTDNEKSSLSNSSKLLPTAYTMDQVLPFNPNQMFLGPEDKYIKSATRTYHKIPTNPSVMSNNRGAEIPSSLEYILDIPIIHDEPSSKNNPTWGRLILDALRRLVANKKTTRITERLKLDNMYKDMDSRSNQDKLDWKNGLVNEAQLNYLLSFLSNTIPFPDTPEKNKNKYLSSSDSQIINSNDQSNSLNNSNSNSTTTTTTNNNSSTTTTTNNNTNNNINNNNNTSSVPNSTNNSNNSSPEQQDVIDMELKLEPDNSMNFPIEINMDSLGSYIDDSFTFDNSSYDDTATISSDDKNLPITTVMPPTTISTTSTPQTVTNTIPTTTPTIISPPTITTTTTTTKTTSPPTITTTSPPTITTTTTTTATAATTTATNSITPTTSTSSTINSNTTPMLDIVIDPVISLELLDENQQQQQQNKEVKEENVHSKQQPPQQQEDFMIQVQTSDLETQTQIQQDKEEIQVKPIVDSKKSGNSPTQIHQQQQQHHHQHNTLTQGFEFGMMMDIMNSPSSTSSMKRKRDDVDQPINQINNPSMVVQQNNDFFSDFNTIEAPFSSSHHSSQLSFQTPFSPDIVIDSDFQNKKRIVS
ncbi:hypothetical protein ACTFIW_005837 [Dictyostelium discoideum]